MIRRVLVTDGNQRSALAVVRALGRAGIDVVAGEVTRRSLASSSRYCRTGFAYPSPYEDPDGFARTVGDTALREGVELVIPMTDIASAILAEYRQERTDFRLPVAVPDIETFWRASDKHSLHHLADELGVPTPTVRYVEADADPEAVAADLTYPCVIKPSRSRRRTESGWIATSVLRAASREDLLTLVRTRPELRFPFMIQRQIDGAGTGVFALCDRGEPRLVFAHRRIREKPPWGGVSVLREAVAPDPVAVEYASRLLRALRWHGVGMVEFKKERSTGIPYLMEMNGRFWGSLQLAIDAGLDFPVNLVKLYGGEPLDVPDSYRRGIRSRWLLGDVDHLLARLTRKAAVPADAPSLPSLLVDFCRFFRTDTRYEVESLGDPGPSMYEMRSYARDLFRGLTR